jgi:hypothetical protein
MQAQSPARASGIDDDDTIGEHIRTDGKELMMEVPSPGRPGGKVMLTSTTMSPVFMKQLREKIEKSV